MKKRLLYVFVPVIVLGVAGYFLVYSWLTLTPPEISDTAVLQKQVTRNSDSLRSIDNCWLHLNDKGLWEMYTEGKPFERGVIAGKLSEDLIHFQEKAFISRIDELIPSKGYQRFLRLLIAIFNKDIDTYIPKEYLQEIYGISRSASDDYDFVGPKYDRILQYHGAHDIGHMLQNYNLVGCTSFAVWGNKSADSTLLIGRNFDFYVGDDFAQNKIVQFCKPDSGYGFMMVTWGAMCGAVSGMNEKGLTITLNAAKSAIPLSAAEPVSLIAREILQYASTIDEAYAIAKQKKCFVSESYLIGSVKDNCAAVIEISPYKTGLYNVPGNEIICTNHFQSDELKNDLLNIRHIRRSASEYRYKRVEELLAGHDSLTVYDAAKILRDQKGLRNTNIGMGNEKAVNQLVCHHSIIFKPASGLVWISAGPFQEGEYICYDLHQILAGPNLVYKRSCVYKKALTLPPDTFLGSSGWKKFLEFRRQSADISNTEGDEPDRFSDERITEYVRLNPEYYYTFEICGDYFFRTGKPEKAKEFYKQALDKEIPTLDEKERVEKKLKNCAEK